MSATETVGPSATERQEERHYTEWRTAGLPINATPGVLVASFLAAGAGSRLFGFSAYNSNAATRYVQIFDAVDIPADGAVPLMVWQVGTKSTLSTSWMLQALAPQGRLFQRGLWIVNSSTDTTKTLSGADLLLDVQYA